MEENVKRGILAGLSVVARRIIEKKRKRLRDEENTAGS